MTEISEVRLDELYRGCPACEGGVDEAACVCPDGDEIRALVEEIRRARGWVISTKSASVGPSEIVDPAFPSEVGDWGGLSVVVALATDTRLGLRIALRLGKACLRLRLYYDPDSDLRGSVRRALEAAEAWANDPTDDRLRAWGSAWSRCTGLDWVPEPGVGLGSRRYEWVEAASLLGRERAWVLAREVWQERGVRS